MKVRKEFGDQNSDDQQLEGLGNTQTWSGVTFNAPLGFGCDVRLVAPPVHPILLQLGTLRTHRQCEGEQSLDISNGASLHSIPAYG